MIHAFLIARVNSQRMVGKSTFVICRFVGILALIFIVFCVALEITYDQPLVKVLECKASKCVECAYLRTGALFVLVAAILLCIFLAQVVVSICDLSACSAVFCSSFAFQAVSIIASFYSWCACVSAIIVYMIGEAMQYGLQFPNWGNITLVIEGANCDKVKHYGIFGAAALLSLAGVTLGIISYLALLLGDSRKCRFQAKINASDLEA
ncbi:uncharacterized protein LOC141656041 [Silene latifolia]|uniref:uncharacterized protein LOC141656041 n=1 Tax=Silene latifolia TaxID=37657 RepID=UPI003D775D09